MSESNPVPAADSGNVSLRSFTRSAILQSALLVGVLVVLGFIARQQVREVYTGSLVTQLEDSVSVLFRNLPQKLDAQWCFEMADQTRMRVSVVNGKDGLMICDNAYPLGSLPPILDRPEIIMAREAPDHRGRSVRMSIFTKNLERIYVAAYSPERDVFVRAGLPLAKLHDALTAFDRLFIFGILIASIILAAILLWTARRVSFVQATRALELSRRKMQEDFVANVSHEFRTPLSSIRGFAGTLRDDLKTGRAVEAEFVDIIVKDSDRLLGLVNDLLDLSALDTGSMPMYPEETPVRELTEDVIKRLSVVYAAKKQKISASYEVDTVMADPERLVQILLNLVGNSLNHCPAGSEVRIVWRAYGAGVELIVSDNGPGISSKAQAHLFDRFVRGEGKAPGTGLGLAIVKQLVEAHDGEIRLESEPGRGATFFLNFPTKSV